jgi:NAD(P)-dependent dehydrogenase (short-subunit alcohol dehydrogenase family)
MNATRVCKRAVSSLRATLLASAQLVEEFALQRSRVAILDTATGPAEELILSLDGRSAHQPLFRQCGVTDIALKRCLLPGYVARTALFLASDDSTAITNQNLIVDGGWV